MDWIENEIFLSSIFPFESSPFPSAFGVGSFCVLMSFVEIAESAESEFRFILS